MCRKRDIFFTQFNFEDIFISHTILSLGQSQFDIKKLQVAFPAMELSPATSISSHL